jgi:MFS family permease
MVGAGVLLYWTKELSQIVGFFIIFAIGALARFISAAYIAQMSDVPQRRDPASEFTFLMFLARFRESNFVKFVAFVSSLTFASFLAAPFFSVFMLRDLELSYLNYMLLQVVSTLTGLLALPLWGRHADLVGNVRVLRLTGFLSTLIPFFWLVSRNIFYLALVQMFAGFAWSGVTLCASNFIYDAVTPQKRVRCIGYFNVINGTALFLGASVGGFLASRLPPLQGYSLLSLFALSSLCRLIFYFILFHRFQEVRPSREVSIQELFFSVVGIRPLIGTSRD